MRPDRMTTKSREAFQDGIGRASRFGNPELQPEHLLAAMLEQEGGVAGPLVQKAGADVAALRAAVARKVEGLPRVTGGAEPGLSRRTLEIIRRADDEAKQLKDEYVSVEHYLLAMSRHDRDMKALFEQSGLDSEKATGRACQRARRSAHHRPGPRGQVPGAGEVLPGPDGRGAKGENGPCRRSRRRDSPGDAGPFPGAPRITRCSIGEPGVGKTAIVEEIAQRIGARRRTRVAQEQAALRAGHGRPGCRSEVNRGGEFEERFEGRAERGRCGAGADRSLHR